MTKGIYDHVVKDAKMNEISIGAFKEKVLLVVNVASECGFTYQYEGLQKLYSKYAQDGLEILGFPCNQFKAQESGTNEEIQFFCTEKYDVSFNEFLKNERPGIMGTKNIKWNFSKFLVSKNGEVIKRYGPTTKPEAIESDIVRLL
jgi:glutathione peroxidase